MDGTKSILQSLGGKKIQGRLVLRDMTKSKGPGSRATEAGEAGRFSCRPLWLTRLFQLWSTMQKRPTCCLNRLFHLLLHASIPNAPSVLLWLLLHGFIRQPSLLCLLTASPRPGWEGGRGGPGMLHRTRGGSRKRLPAFKGASPAHQTGFKLTHYKHTCMALTDCCTMFTTCSKLTGETWPVCKQHSGMREHKPTLRLSVSATAQTACTARPQGHRHRCYSPSKLHLSVLCAALRQILGWTQKQHAPCQPC